MAPLISSLHHLPRKKNAVNPHLIRSSATPRKSIHLNPHLLSYIIHLTTSTNSQEKMSSIPLLVSIFSLFFLESSSGSSIVFTTLGRSRYTFDIFATPLTSPSDELRLTDGISVNFNGFFTSSSLLFISERNSSSNIYSLPIPFTSPSRRELLPLANPLPLLDSSHQAMIDRPSLSGDHLIYVSTHHPSHYPRSSWAAVYSTHLPSGLTRRLTPSDTADFSPSVSPSGLWTAVASTGDHPWSGEVQELNTSIYLVRTHDGSERTLLINHAGWPCWGAADSTLFFHRRSSDGWWSIYRATINTTTNNPILISIERVTSPGFHAFTPAATAGDPNLIAVATRRPTSNFRHIELIDLRLSNPNYIEITRAIAPNSHHYNPFISPDATMIGYYRCRKGNGDPPLMFENIRSPSSDTLSLLRIDGSFPSFSPDGSHIAYVRLPGLFVVNSDGSGGPVEVFKGNAFGTAWDWKRRGVIYTSYGPEFATERTRVDVISVTLDEDSEPLIKRLTVNGENNAFPSPSPDGKWVVFRSGRSGHKNLYIMDAVEGEAAGIHRLTEGPWSDTMCNWSPDGEWIAFASDRGNPGGGGFAIYMVHPNGTGLRKVVHSGDGGRTNHPWFSPDSKSLVFTSDYAAVSAEPIANPHHYQPYGDIFTVNIDGSDLRRLTHNSYEDGTPTWSPFSLKPTDVAEVLKGNALCSFDDCHWLNTQRSFSDLSPGASC